MMFPVRVAIAINRCRQRRLGSFPSVLKRTASSQSSKLIPEDGLTLNDFVSGSATKNHEPTTHSTSDNAASSRLSFHLKTYGCQMNVSDSDIVRALLLEQGFREVPEESQAQVLLTNTCAIREGAEEKVWHRMRELRGRFARKKGKKLVGVLGCMAERLKEDLFQDGLADLVVGPDAYRDLPRLLQDLASETSQVEKAVSVQLSMEETYADITPVRRNTDDVSAFVSIQRGCSNRCSFCIVPFTRGGVERSRPFQSVISEVQALYDEGVKEVTLLGQNVNSYHDQSETAIAMMPDSDYTMSNQGFKSRIRRRGGGYFFADLVEAVSNISPELRVRFTSPHPKDYPPELLSLMAEKPNVCKSLHMPAQSGSSSVLKRMRRGYTREAYLDLISDVQATIPEVAISSDFISGFCDETEGEHQDTLSLMEKVRYDQAFMFAYSLREKTHAHRTMQDNIPQEIKLRRLREVIDTFRYHVQRKNEEVELGRLRLVLVEGESKRSKPGNRSWSGRTDQNKRILFPSDEEACTSYSERALHQILGHVNASGSHHALPRGDLDSMTRVDLKSGDYAICEVTEVKGHGLRGRLLCRSSIQQFAESGLDSIFDDAARERARCLKEAFNLMDDGLASESPRQAFP
ncbi:tRNA-2-methylthio-N(6)-dimethylallyladenosine synthase [Seminavis robusta]|uniref:tRNA-2-methylthio-N(6)-dimethylallyladenosine synthase n=1 Tax=Seminavis robusta TaxID=568900 RepID=A0A9N8HR16_9STRA|nr:tRNA-2-methylthio-N(6)-dimethylallyladenosine synthase [Seminavis robusta]|eukprot:Sro1348_g265070.1 tRNA-2-methylthio-N(6)-dimethylallyladenosine synthase (633) ;mRNA; r:28888-30786